MADAFKNVWSKNRWIVILAAVLVVVIIALLGIIVYNGIILRDRSDAPQGAATGAATETVVVVSTATAGGATTIAGDITPTPVDVIKKGTATATAAKTPAKSSPTATPAPTGKPTSTSAITPEPVDTLEPTNTPEPEIVNVIGNGGFEWGFGEDGVAAPWKRFTNGGAKTIFAPETWSPAIRNGDQAQRITIYEAHLPDRYAGIYQTVPVEPGQTYRLTLYGQTRSSAGDIATSSYGYRMQYAVDWQGGVDWQAIPADEWVELPWDEQLLDGADVEFLEYSAELTPRNSQVTVFIRAWNKWPDPVEAQYTLDTLSLVGPKPQAALVDKSLPNSGGVTEATLPGDPLFWGSLAFLIFLIGGTVWRFRNKRWT